MSKIYGYELIMNFQECDIIIITSRAKLKEYVDKLCELIKMKKYGKILLPYFAATRMKTRFITR